MASFPSVKRMKRLISFLLKKVNNKAQLDFSNASKISPHQHSLQCNEPFGCHLHRMKHATFCYNPYQSQPLNHNNQLSEVVKSIKDTSRPQETSPQACTPGNGSLETLVNKWALIGETGNSLGFPDGAVSQTDHFDCGAILTHQLIVFRLYFHNTSLPSHQIAHHRCSTVLRHVLARTHSVFVLSAHAHSLACWHDDDTYQKTSCEGFCHFFVSAALPVAVPMQTLDCVDEWLSQSHSCYV